MIGSSQKNRLNGAGFLIGCMLVLSFGRSDLASAQNQDTEKYDAVFVSPDLQEGEPLHGSCIPAPAIPWDDMTALQKHLLVLYASTRERHFRLSVIDKG